MWISIIVALFFSFALARTFVNNHRYETRIRELKTGGAFRENEQQEHKVLEKEGYDIHYFTSGSKGKELLIFLPAAFCSHSTFDHQVEHFSKKYRVIAIDLLGHGLSQVRESADRIDASAEHILRIMEREGYDKAHIIGVSMGSLIAQYFAMLHPDKVASVTVTGGYSIHRDNSEISKAQIFEKLKWPMKILVSMDSFRRYVASMAVIKTDEQAKVYESTKGFTRKSFKVMQGLNKMDSLENTSRNNYPLLLLVGDHDLNISIRYAQKWHSEDAESRFYILKNAGHNANMDNFKEFNRIVEHFIEHKKVIL